MAGTISIGEAIAADIQILVPLFFGLDSFRFSYFSISIPFSLRRSLSTDRDCAEPRKQKKWLANRARTTLESSAERDGGVMTDISVGGSERPDCRIERGKRGQLRPDG